MRTVEDLLEEAKQRPAARESGEGPYAALLRSAGSAHSLAPDVARHKNEHLAEIYAPKRTDR